ncbi:MAG: pentapeptide repeat-containing protein [Capnocytophaga sp.]|nr:pentapeptide repeat-containing protein [Capnocytophaga sp.]
MAISIKLKKRWDIYPTLQDVLTATQNLSVSPFGLTEEGLQDFRGIKLIGERKSVPLREGYMWENISKPLHTSLSYADFSGSVWQYFAIEETEDFTAVIDHVIFDESVFELSAYAICGRDATFLSCSFANCKYKWGEFIRATLKDCRFTQIKKNVRLKFNSCKLLENCLFSGEIHKTLFWHSNLKNCTFEGVLYDCSFYGVEKIGDLRKGEIIPPENVDNRMDGVDFSKAELIMCNFTSFCYLDKVKPSEKNCIFKATDEFYSYLLATIERSDSPLKKDLTKWAALLYAPHITEPYRVAHPDDLSFKYPEKVALSQTLYDFVCEAAEATGCRVKN